MWRADASITTGTYNTKRKSMTCETSAESWDSTPIRNSKRSRIDQHHYVWQVEPPR